jgi:1-acyl-sn-glycerol-3-phosphate acyltransferase
MYPEGSRTPDGRLYRGKTGIARLALSADVPVVPVGVVGTHYAMPGGRSWPVPGKVEVRFGKPLTFERYHVGVPSQLVLRAITDQIMYDIMALAGLTYADEYVSKAKARQRSRVEAVPPAADATGQKAGATGQKAGGTGQETDQAGPEARETPDAPRDVSPG